MEEKVLIIDFGSQYTQLIARRVRELYVYCEIHPYNNLNVDLNSFKAVILSGSPFSVRSDDALHIDLSEIKGKKPLLGVCYGAQYIAHFFGGKVIPSNKREYGRAKLMEIDSESLLFNGVDLGSQVWMSHSDTIETLPLNSKCISSTADVKNAAFSIIDENLYGIQFHPEVYHSKDGKKIIENFLLNIAKINPDWTPDVFSEKTINDIKNKIGDDKVILGLSGGVDSTVAGVLIHKAIKDNLHCIFVNNGLLRKNEFNSVLDQYKGMGLNVKGVDASEYFIKKLSGIDDPEKKRKIIGKAFIDVFDQESKLIGDEIKKLTGLNVLVINALRQKPHLSHFNLEEALNFIKLVNPKKTYLTHISHHLGFHDEVEQSLPENVFLAYDNLKISV